MSYIVNMAQQFRDFFNMDQMYTSTEQGKLNFRCVKACD